MQFNREGQGGPLAGDEPGAIPDGLAPRFGGRAEAGTRGERVVRRLRGSASTGMTTDHIMALTRGE